MSLGREVRRTDVTAADGTRIALYRVGDPAGAPVVLMPGTFSNHTFWLGTRGRGMAWALAEAGFEAVVMDPRGHGGSDRPRGEAWRFEDWGRLDVPAVVSAVVAERGRTLLVGHSAGGASMLIGLAAEAAMREHVAGLVALASPLPWLQGWRRPGAHAIRAMSRLLGRFPARRMGLGPEDEMPGVMDQWMGWNLRGEWVGDDGMEYTARFAQVRTPVLAMSGAGDTMFAPPHACRELLDLMGSPDREYRLAGTATGYSEDFDHAGIVVSRAARTEVWPEIVRWLRAHVAGSRRGLHAG